MNIVDGEPGLFGQFLIWIIESVDSLFGRKLTFGELLLEFERTAYLEKTLRERGFILQSYGEL